MKRHKLVKPATSWPQMTMSPIYVLRMMSRLLIPPAKLRAASPGDLTRRAGSTHQMTCANPFPPDTVKMSKAAGPPLVRTGGRARVLRPRCPELRGGRLSLLVKQKADAAVSTVLDANAKLRPNSVGDSPCHARRYRPIGVGKGSGTLNRPVQARTAFMKRSRITTGSIVITGSLMLPLSHLHTITVIFLLSMAACSARPVSTS